MMLIGRRGGGGVMIKGNWCRSLPCSWRVVVWGLAGRHGAQMSGHQYLGGRLHVLQEEESGSCKYGCCCGGW